MCSRSSKEDGPTEIANSTRFYAETDLVGDSISYHLLEARLEGPLYYKHACGKVIGASWYACLVMRPAHSSVCGTGGRQRRLCTILIKSSLP